MWPTRSRHLFSWDSANFAFALSRIDIATHRPHPPGYLGYVFAARALNHLTHDANAAFVVWNIAALSAAAVLTWWFTLAAGASVQAAAAAGVLLIASPLVWLYAATAEIYVSEMLCTLCMAASALATLRGQRHGRLLLAAALALTAVFKLSGAVLMLPLAAYAWLRGPQPVRARDWVLLVALPGLAAVLFLVVQPDMLAITWAQFRAATAESGVLTAGDVGGALNRNARDTLTALVPALGVINVIGLLWWAAVDRRPLPNTGWIPIALWALPYLALVLLVHIGRPGYVLPLAPLACIIAAAFFARRGIAVMTGAVALQAVAAAAWVAVLHPAAPGAQPPVRYRDKSLLQRMVSDMQPLTLSTRATVQERDRAIDQLVSVSQEGCSSGEWIVVAGAGAVDWRRAMYYVPRARAIHVLDDNRPVYIGTNGDSVDIPPSGLPIASECGLLWITRNRQEVTAAQALAAPMGDIGWRLPPGTGRVGSEGISWAPR